MRIVNLCLALSFVVALAINGYAQSGNPGNIMLKNDLSAIKAIREQLPIEKLYIQLDKPYYTSGDTLHFKAYLFRADYLTPSMQSGLLYIELDGTDNAPTKKIMIPVSAGLGWGDIALDEKAIPAATYTLRAYTNWMRNFGEVYVFKQQVNILPIANSTLIKTSFKLQRRAGKQNVEAALQLTTLEGRIQALQDMQLRVMEGKKNLSKDKVSTGFDGVVKANFDVPAQTPTSNLSIKLQQAGKVGELTIPVVVNRPENTDLQFMPEGGSLVAGIPTKVGFKAIAEDGNGAKVSGTIVDSKQQQVASLSATHAGMGSVEFTPQAGESYTAKVILPGGTVKTYSLPDINQAGTTLRITDNNNDSLSISLNSSGINKQDTCYLIGQSRGVVCYAQSIFFANGPVLKQVDKALLPTGIARFTLLNTQHQPLNERTVFINHHDELQVAIKANQQQYAIRDSIALTIQVKDKDGKPVQGSFSLSVTDDSQVKTDSLGSNILNSLLLTSDLKGTVEDPGYYFIGDKAAELDNLLLTQGWTGYDWKEVFYPAQPVYQPEKEFMVKGTVTNALGKPLEKSKIVLMANHPLIFKDTVSDKNGHFTFTGLFPVDTALFKLQARNKRGNDFNVQIKADEVTPPAFSSPAHLTPWYVNSDSSLMNNAKTRIAEQEAISGYRGEGHVLKDVIIKDKKFIPGSKNLNGPGEADQVIDQEELEKAGKMTLRELLQQKIKGLHFGPFTPPKRYYPPSLELASYLQQDFPTLKSEQAQALADVLNRNFARPFLPWRAGYIINSQEVHFIIDGIDLDYFYNDEDEGFININHKDEGAPLTHIRYDTKRYQYINNYLDYFTAEDITGIELMSNDKYAANYDIEFDRYRDRMVPGRSNSFAYLEITTRAKQGPFMKVVPGTYLYKTLAFTLPRQFYCPKYTVKTKNTAIGTDLRSTIYWAPNIITDKEGKAVVSFYSADRAGNYTVTIEGTDMDGDLGYRQQKIKIK
ncbi:MAG: hypothetical protein ACXVAY_16275 [Mucilaginibacter sp.]